MIPNRVLAAFFALCALAVLGVSFALSPDPRGFGTHEALGLPPCGFLVANGYPCMTCGMTTAFSNMAHLNLRAAFVANPMGVAMFGLTVATLISMSRCLYRNTDPLAPFRHRFAPHSIVVGSALLLVNWLWLIKQSSS